MQPDGTTQVFVNREIFFSKKGRSQTRSILFYRVGVYGVRNRVRLTCPMDKFCISHYLHDVFLMTSTILAGGHREVTLTNSRRWEDRPREAANQLAAFN